MNIYLRLRKTGISVLKVYPLSKAVTSERLKIACDTLLFQIVNRVYHLIEKRIEMFHHRIIEPFSVLIIQLLSRS